MPIIFKQSSALSPEVQGCPSSVIRRLPRGDEGGSKGRGSQGTTLCREVHIEFFTFIRILCGFPCFSPERNIWKPLSSRNPSFSSVLTLPPTPSEASKRTKGTEEEERTRAARRPASPAPTTTTGTSSGGTAGPQHRGVRKKGRGDATPLSTRFSDGRVIQGLAVANACRASTHSERSAGSGLYSGLIVLVESPCSTPQMSCTTKELS